MPEDCLEKWLNRFHVYDQTVDIVSCWEASLTYSFESLFSNYHFERFPSLPWEGDDDITPDFTVYFSEDYGIIGEVKRTFPDEEVAFDSTLNQVSNYDRDLALKTGGGDRQIPDICDILLVISGTSSPQIGTRLSRKIGPGLIHNFENNLVLVRYQYNRDATWSRYEFQRETQLAFEFRDNVLPADASLSNKIGEPGDYGTLPVYPKHFAPLKVKRPFCNDEPPGPYMATILWHRIFPEFLDRSDFREWAQGNTTKTMPVTTTPQTLQNQMDSYLGDGQIRLQWISDALEFLADAKLATREGDEYTIGFRDLVRDVGADEPQEGSQMLRQIKELGYMFTSRYCEYTDEELTESDSTQSSLGEY